MIGAIEIVKLDFNPLRASYSQRMVLTWLTIRSKRTDTSSIVPVSSPIQMKSRRRMRNAMRWMTRMSTVLRKSLLANLSATRVQAARPQLLVHLASSEQAVHRWTTPCKTDLHDEHPDRYFWCFLPYNTMNRPVVSLYEQRGQLIKI